MDKKIKGTNILGVERVYTFELMDAETGTEIMHEWGGKAAMSYEAIADLYRGVVNGIRNSEDEIGLIEKASLAMTVISKMPEVLTFDVVKDLAGKMLAGHTMTEDNETYTANENGFTNDYGDPLEVYCALYYAIRANYGKYIDPLLSTLADVEDSE